MAEIELVAEAGRLLGTRPARRLRAEGKVPGVIYGHGIQPLPVAVNGRELRHALTGDAGLNTLVALKVDGTTHLTLAREVQRHPVRGTVSHVDFVIVRRDEVVSADVPVNLVGEATELHRGDGIVEQQLFSLAIHATPSNIPPSIEVDINELTIGTTIRVGDLRLPSGVTTDVDPEDPVVVGLPPAVVVEEAAAEEAAEGAEVTEAAAAEAGERDAGGAARGEAAGPSEG